MAAVLRSIFGFPLCCFPCLGKAKKNPVSQASAGIGDLCGSSGAEEKCPLFKIFDGSSSRLVYIYQNDHANHLHLKKRISLNKSLVFLLFYKDLRLQFATMVYSLASFDLY